MEKSFQQVEDWLRNLGLLQYAQSFYDNGYEEIETCKLISEKDLDVIKIKSERDRNDILSAVIKLNQNLYFELEEEKLDASFPREKMDKVLLKSKLKECLIKHHIQLTEPPYLNHDGSMGDLYTISIRLADELETFVEDVLEALEQLRKRQLPVETYNQMTELTTKPKERSMTSDPAEYLDVETSKKVSRTLSFSKYDTRVTKSTTDLSSELLRQKSKGIKKHQESKQKSLFGHVFKRTKDTSKGKGDQWKSSFDFNATDVTFSQNEIVTLFAKVKNKEISQEDALAAVQKRGLSKSSSGEGSDHLSIDRSPPLDTVSLNRYGKGRLSKSMIKKATATAQFYTDDDLPNNTDFHARYHERSASLLTDIDYSTKASPDLSKPGIFKMIRGSLRKKTKSSDGSSSEKDARSPSGSISSQENLVNSSPKSPNTQPKYVDLTKIKKRSDSDDSTTDLTQVCVLPPTPPPRKDLIKDSVPSVEGDAQDEEEDGFKERRPSLKIKSYTKYQKEASKRRAQEGESDDERPKHLPLVSKTELEKVVTNLHKVESMKSPPRITHAAHDGPRPVRRVKSLLSPDKDVPVAPPRRKKSSPLHEQKNIDDIGIEMSRLIEDLNDDLTSLNKVDVENKIPSTSRPKPPVRPILPLLRPKPPARKNLPNEPSDTNNNGVIDSTSTSFKELTMELDRLSSSSTSEAGGSLQRKLELKERSESMDRRRNHLKPPSLKQMLVKKLRKEEIKLHEAPYTEEDGSWNVPGKLIERYADELQQSSSEIVECFEAVRVEKLKANDMPIVTYDPNGSSRMVYAPHDVTLRQWLVHIGLPMFSGDLEDAGIFTVNELADLKLEDLKQISVCDEKHMLLLISYAIAFNETHL